MKDTSSSKSIADILKDPSEIGKLLSNPGKYGLDFYNGLSAQNKQYIAFAAAAGLVVYGLSLSRKKGK